MFKTKKKTSTKIFIFRKQQIISPQAKKNLTIVNQDLNVITYSEPRFKKIKVKYD